MLAASLWLVAAVAFAQDDFTRVDEDGNLSTANNKKDSLGSDKEIPKGLKVWIRDLATALRLNPTHCRTCS